MRKYFGIWNYHDTDIMAPWFVLMWCGVFMFVVDFALVRPVILSLVLMIVSVIAIYSASFTHQCTQPCTEYQLSPKLRKIVKQTAQQQRDRLNILMEPYLLIGIDVEQAKLRAMEELRHELSKKLQEYTAADKELATLGLKN